MAVQAEPLVQVRLVQCRSTKGLLRYEEVVLEGQRPLVGVLYLAKDRLGAKPPKCVVVEVREDHDATN